MGEQGLSAGWGKRVVDANNSADVGDGPPSSEGGELDVQSLPEPSSDTEEAPGVDRGPDPITDFERDLEAGSAPGVERGVAPSGTTSNSGWTDTVSELRMIRAELAELRSIVQARFDEDRTKDEAFDRLYGDLEIFRAQAAFQASRAVFLDVILLIDRLEAALEGELDPADGRAMLESVQVELLELLARRTVIPVAATDDTFDPKIQRAVETVPVDRLEQHNSIDRVVRQGYEQDGQAIRTADVIVRRFASTATGDA